MYDQGPSYMRIALLITIEAKCQHILVSLNEKHTALISWALLACLTTILLKTNKFSSTCSSFTFDAIALKIVILDSFRDLIRTGLCWRNLVPACPQICPHNWSWHYSLSISSISHNQWLNIILCKLDYLLGDTCNKSISSEDDILSLWAQELKISLSGWEYKCPVLLLCMQSLAIDIQEHCPTQIGNPYHLGEVLKTLDWVYRCVHKSWELHIYGSQCLSYIWSYKSVTVPWAVGHRTLLHQLPP